MENNMVVLYPGLGVGHIVPMVELAKLLIREGFSVTVVIIDPPGKTSSDNKAIARISEDNPSINFHILPPVPLPSDAPIVEFMLESPRLQRSNLLSFLGTLPSLRAIIVDFFCAEVMDVANKLRVPAYIYFTSPALGLSVSLYYPFFHMKISANPKDMGDVPLHFPGVVPLFASDLPDLMADWDKPIFNSFMSIFKALPNANGILVNTFEWFENKAVKAIKDGLSVPGGSTPPIYCIGPIVRKGICKEEEGGHGCLAWLDKQPKQSVVFLCFGSMGTFSSEQLKEIAIGLETSGQRFLWVVRNPTNISGEPNLDQMLPKGFLDRTKDRGMVVKSWAPQVEVLQHNAVGGFVSHCGWNSTLEAVMAGVPMISWPLYAEQRMNRKYLVEEMKVAVSIEGYDKGLVHAEEVETKVRWLMESKGGGELRKRMAEVRDKAMEAVMEGGQSWNAFKKFINIITVTE